MTYIRTIPGSGPTALGLVLEKPQHQIPNGAKPIQPKDSYCSEHGDVQIVAEFGRIDILSCGCEFDTSTGE